MKNELLAGLTTFATIAYIIVVNPQILSQAGLSFEAVMVATILTSAFATLMMGLYADYPFALAPGMGLNAYFTYGIVLGSGFTWQAALGICFISGVIILVLNTLGLRVLILNAIPRSLRLASSAGIGLFLLFIGFQNIALIAAHENTLVSLGKVATPAVIFAALGVVITGALMALRVQGAILIGILLISAAAWLTNTTEIQGFMSLPPSLGDTFLQLDLVRAVQWDAWPIILTFVFIAMFDTAGTVYALSEQGGFVKDGKVPRAKRILTCDALGTIAGGMLGSSPVTTYLESAAGITAGGRRGLTAVTVAVLFLCTLFFSPLVTSIPLFATVPALIIVGALMIQAMVKIDWEDPTEYIPSAILIASIPLTYSIAEGIALGFITYPFMKLLSGRFREVRFFLWIIAAFFVMRYAIL